MKPKVDISNTLPYLNRHLYLSGKSSGVAPRTKYQRHICLKQIGLCVQNKITILDSIININGGPM